MRTLSLNSNGADVMFLQCLLNKRNANPRLVEDGSFGQRTKTALMAYQRGARPPLVADGVAGPKTWTSLGTLTERLHAVNLLGQPSNMSCWSAAASMILGNMSVGSGAAHASDDGGLTPDLDNVEVFLRGLNWRVLNNQSRPGLSSLLAPLRQGPLWVVFEGGSFKHAVVFSGFYTDVAGDESATVFRIHDPWPPGRGTVYGSTYHNSVVSLRSIQPPKQAMIQYVASPR